MRRIFIGDLQGCSTQLDELLDALSFAPGDRLYSVGDLVNRGPDSLGVLRRMRRLGARVVLGNHDLYLLKIAAGTAAAKSSDRFDTIWKAPDCDELLEWLRLQPVLMVEDDVAVVHGGLHPKWNDLEGIQSALNAAVPSYLSGTPHDGIEFATQVRYCDPQGRRPESDDPPPPPPFAPWDLYYSGARTLVCGHWARRGLVVKPRLRSLDTGCVYGGTLTAWIADEDRIVRVPGWRG
jgi:bis(5'-nucleosyl)-tetraphosphatase (symmetrical)